MQHSIAARIAPEVLTKIFVENVDGFQDDDYQWRSQPYKWVSIGQVCKHWRSTALGFPQMWACIVTLNLEWTQECLRRSQHMPLQVIHLINRDPAVTARRMESLLAVLHELPRIRLLRLEMSVAAYESLEQIKDWNLERSLLQSVQLEISDHPRDCTELLALFTEGAFNLQALITRCHSTVWTTGPFQATLKHVEIKLAHYELGINPVLDALNNMPLLESLNLVDLPSARDVGSDLLPVVDRVVELPRLRLLVLDAPATECARFLYHLSFPAFTRLDITCECVDLDEEPRNLAMCISSWLKKPLTSEESPEPIRSVAVHIAEHHIWRMVTFYAWRSNVALADLADTEYDEEPSIPPNLTVKFQVSIDEPKHEDRAMVEFCGNLSMSEVEVAYIGSMLLKDSKETLSRALRSMNNLHTLAIVARSGRAMPFLLQISPPVFPALKTLQLEAVRMIAEATPALLCDALLARRELGLPVNILIIRNCTNVKFLDVDGLRETVGAVDWDDDPTSDNEEESDLGEDEDEENEGDENDDDEDGCAEDDGDEDDGDEDNSEEDDGENNANNNEHEF